jgi:hypothetical protein
MFKWQIAIDRHSPRLIPNHYHLSAEPHFSLLSTFNNLNELLSLTQNLSPDVKCIRCKIFKTDLKRLQDLGLDITDGLGSVQGQGQDPLVRARLRPAPER